MPRSVPSLIAFNHYRFTVFKRFLHLRKRFAACLMGFTRLSISQTLARDALQCLLSAFRVVNAKRDAVRIAEIELGQIAVQVLFGTVLLDARHAALEDRVVAFHRVGVDFARLPILAALMGHAAV